jgi:hypothetical protein
VNFLYDIAMVLQSILMKYLQMRVLEIGYKTKRIFTFKLDHGQKLVGNRSEDMEIF